MPITRRQMIHCTGASALLASLAPGAFAQAGAFESARIVTGFPPGGRPTRSAGASPSV